MQDLLPLGTARHARDERGAIQRARAVSVVFRLISAGGAAEDGGDEDGHDLARRGGERRREAVREVLGYGAGRGGEDDLRGGLEVRGGRRGVASGGGGGEDERGGGGCAAQRRLGLHGGRGGSGDDGRGRARPCCAEQCLPLKALFFVVLQYAVLLGRHVGRGGRL